MGNVIKRKENEDEGQSRDVRPGLGLEKKKLDLPNFQNIVPKLGLREKVGGVHVSKYCTAPTKCSARVTRDDAEQLRVR